MAIHMPPIDPGLSTSWRADAACRLFPPDLFFPTGTANGAQDDIAAAKRICGICEVREPCLEFALANRQEFGVWGGLDEEERRAERRARRAGAAAG